MKIDQNKPQPEDILNLEQLRRVDPASETDIIKQKLAKLFELQEPSRDFKHYTREQIAQQNKLINKIKRLTELYHKYKDSKKGRDTTNACRLIIARISEAIDEIDFVSKITKEFVNDLIKVLEEDGSASNQAIKHIKEQMNEKKYKLFSISQPDQLKKKLYDTYRSLDLPREERKKFLKVAIKLTRELTRTQTNAFLTSYEQIWETFQDSGLKTINISLDDIRTIFLKNGYEMSSEGNIDFAKTLSKAKESHNDLLEVLGKQFDLEDDSPEQIGKEIFRALLRSRDIDSSQFPFGEVKLDTRSPVTSIRLICSDVRDYKFITYEIKNQEYQWASLKPTASGGSSFRNKQIFSFKDKTRAYLPLTVINGSTSVSSQAKFITHEDAHQTMNINQKIRNSRKSAQNRDKFSLEYQVVFNEKDLIENDELIEVSIWQTKIKKQLSSSLLYLRDEVQAYLASGASIDEPREYLSNSSPEALYDYVCDFDFRVSTINNLKNDFSDNEEVLKLLISAFKEDVIAARTLYDQNREKYIDRVERLINLFMNNDTQEVAQQKVALLVRNTTPDELLNITKYLSSSITKKPKIEVQNKDIPSPEINEQIAALNDRQLEKLLQKAYPNIKTYLFTQHSILSKAPEFIKKEIPNINDLVSLYTVDITVDILRKYMFLYKLLFQTRSKIILWSKEEEKELKKYNFEIRKELFFSDTSFLEIMIKKL